MSMAGVVSTPVQHALSSGLRPPALPICSSPVAVVLSGSSAVFRVGGEHTFLLPEGLGRISMQAWGAGGGAGCKGAHGACIAFSL